MADLESLRTLLRDESSRWRRETVLTGVPIVELPALTEWVTWEKPLPWWPRLRRWRFRLEGALLRGVWTLPWRPLPRGFSRPSRKVLVCAGIGVIVHPEMAQVLRVHVS